MTQATVLSGIRATGKLHFGNFMGAVTHFVRFQKPENLCMYFVADLHTLTTSRDPEALRGNVLEIVKDYLAAGLDPDQAIIYTQSSVPEISQLSLLLSMVQPLGQLEGLATIKELLGKTTRDQQTLGLVTYPVLMAADILGPQATIVPVGEDQRPNVELARDLADRFNHRYGSTFVLPEMMDESQMVKVPGLRGGKMGKSEGDDTIDINDSMFNIGERYRKRAVTDPQRVRATDPGDPERCQAVYPLHKLITSDHLEIAEQCRKAQIGCTACKGRLVDSIASVLEPFQERRAELAGQDDYVRDVLYEGGRRARNIISRTLEDVQSKMGLVIY